MKRLRQSGTALAHWAFTIAALVAIVGQVAMAFVPLAEGAEGRSMASHVERGGTSAHYAHNDANCAACQARTLLGLASRPQAALPLRAETSEAIVFVAELPATHGLFSHNSRAPPTV
jgi:hypothetical protein